MEFNKAICGPTRAETFVLAVTLGNPKGMTHKSTAEKGAKALLYEKEKLKSGTLIAKEADPPFTDHLLALHNISELQKTWWVPWLRATSTLPSIARKRHCSTSLSYCFTQETRSSPYLSIMVS